MPRECEIPRSGVCPEDRKCPWWNDGIVLDDPAEPAGQPKVYRGCVIDIFIPLMRGVAVTNRESAASMQSARNTLVAGFTGLAEAAGLDPTRVAKRISDADEAANRKALVNPAQARQG